MKTRAIAIVLASGLLATACAGDSATGGSSTETCGHWPAGQQSAAPTPIVSSQKPGNSIDIVVVIGAWSNCVRPDSVTVQPGTLVQWQAAEPALSPEIVLDDGTSFGRVQHVLEFRFVEPGTYRYHFRDSPSVRGIVVVTRR